MNTAGQPLEIPCYEVRIFPRYRDQTGATALDHAELRVRSFTLVESLEAPYRLDIVVLADLRQVHIDPNALLEADFSLEIARDISMRTIHGLIVGVQYATSFADELWLRLTVAPALATLEWTRRSRVFQDLSAPEIVQELVGDELAKYGRAVDLSRLRHPHPPRDYCVQYRETDLEFVRRILAEEGIFAVYDHSDPKVETLVLVDDLNGFTPVGFEPLDTPADAAAPEIPLIDPRPELAHFEGLTGFEWARELTTGTVHVEAWEWKTVPATHLQASATLDGPAPGRVGELYAHGERRLFEAQRGAGDHRDDSPVWANRRLGHCVGHGPRGSGDGLVTGFAAGRIFELPSDTGLDGVNPVLLTRVVHTGDCPDIEQTQAGGAQPGGAQYTNRFSCVDVATPYAPALSAKPHVSGPQTAVVVGPPGEEIHTDRWGRIQVRMHWDREQRAKSSDTSCWLRVAQPWSGPGWGTLFLPRVGMEVLVAFIDGDPDRPICTGCVYNGQNPPPYALPEDRTKSTIKSNSSPGAMGSMSCALKMPRAARRYLFTPKKTSKRS